MFYLKGVGGCQSGFLHCRVQQGRANLFPSKKASERKGKPRDGLGCCWRAPLVSVAWFEQLQKTRAAEATKMMPVGHMPAVKHTLFIYAITEHGFCEVFFVQLFSKLLILGMMLQVSLGISEATPDTISPKTWWS